MKIARCNALKPLHDSVYVGVSCLYKHLFMLKPITPTSEAKEVFTRVLECGFLSHDTKAKNYVANYMYMGIGNNMVLFKHINLRSYFHISLTLLNEL